PPEKELAGEWVRITLSASLDETELIESGRGTGATTRRPPVEARFRSPGANSSPNRNVGWGKMRRASAPLLVTMRRGFLLPRQMAGAQCSAPFKKHRDARSASRRTDKLWKKTLVS